MDLRANDVTRTRRASGQTAEQQAAGGLEKSDFLNRCIIITLYSKNNPASQI